jgi:hypothetical protein
MTPLSLRISRSSGEQAGRWILLALIAAAVCRLWLSPLHSSLWLDETATYWGIQGGAADFSRRISMFPQATHLYMYVISTVVQLAGPSELVLRIPSVVAMGLASVFLYLLAARLIDREAGLLSVAVFVTLPAVAFAAADARPYAMAVLAVVSALWALVRWMDSGRFRDGLIYVILAAATVHVHILFATTLAVHAVYAVSRLWQGTVRPRSLLAVAIAIGVLVLPMWGYVAAIVRNRRYMVFVPPPDGETLLATLAPRVVVGSLVLALLLASAVFRSIAFRPVPVSANGFFLLACSIMGPVGLLYLVSRFGDSSAFVARYLMAITPGMALLTGGIIRMIEPASARRAIVAMHVIVMTHQLGGTGLRYDHSTENWREAMATVRSITSKETQPVLFSGSFIESSDVKRLSDPKHAEYLLAPFGYYPSGSKNFILPILFNEEARVYVERLVSSSPEIRQGFVLVERRCGPMCFAWSVWLRDYLAPNGLVSRSRGTFGNLTVSQFEPESARIRAEAATDMRFGGPARGTP